MAINNEMFSRPDYDWWAEENSNTLLRCFINPLRFQYFLKVLQSRPPEPEAALLDVGCGGGFLSEEFAKAGFRVTGVDPSHNSLRQAADHAAAGGLTIAFQKAYGESLPFEPGVFDYVVCCDVLEHVDDMDRVVGEIARVLRPGGMFLFDTINRTVASAIIVIGLMQEWKFTAFEEPGTHDWNMFIKPTELRTAMKRHGLEPREIKGMTSAANPVSNLVNLRQRARGGISRYELGKRLKICESRDTSMSYMGYAIKQQ